jgi:hypothetical protein
MIFVLVFCTVFAHYYSRALELEHYSIRTVEALSEVRKCDSLQPTNHEEPGGQFMKFSLAWYNQPKLRTHRILNLIFISIALLCFFSKL